MKSPYENEANLVLASKLFDNRITCEWYSTKEAAAFLRITPNALRIMVCRGKVKATKLGSRLRFHVEDLTGLLSKRSAA